MAKLVRSLFFLTLLVTSSFSTPTPQPCSTHHFPDHKSFAACNDLPVLNSTIYWNYFPSNGTVDLAFRATLVGDSGWVAWAINPSSKGMVGSQAFVSFQRRDGTMAVYTSPIKSYGTRLEKGNLTFPVYALSAVHENKDITIFATLGLPNNVTTVNQLWQQGPLHGDTPGMHKMSGPYLKSYGTLDFLSGKVEATGAHHSMVSMKIVHAVLNTVSWGVLLPVGVIVARNFKMYPAWFPVHLTCVISGVTFAVFGFVTGSILGSESTGIQYKGHKSIGWTLLFLSIVQGMVGFYLRPEKGDKDRWLWDLFHRALGYTLLILGQVNIFKGFDILEPPKPWKYAYIGVLALLLLFGAGLACYTCFTQWNKKRTEASKTQLEQSGEGIV
ncbi:PREDICTED: cytochrome b561 and DOMON domain-containing protein At4g17280-like [Fragaria vesca subsp. vesca]|uniref:cytochrome b561 and DOMON domain-containing protein At4g17280-like n=1 Tax=Fragaria vesca subsp. vesca TaxID=101020 RepID=UPI0002C30D94|nr:PREDICTED: cytochrome b561 and DOMON domain-containing protein At4g17280-like [Fragaria vesca subsp. vesca]